MGRYSPTNAKDIVKQIEQADELQLVEIISAAMRRYSALRTDRELSVLSLPTNPKTRNGELEEIICYIRACYNKQES